MLKKRSVATSLTHLIFALSATAAVALVMPSVATAGEIVHGVELLLPPSYDATQEPSTVASDMTRLGPSHEVADHSLSQPLTIVVMPTPPPVPGWGRPPAVDVVVPDDLGEVIVYSPAPEPMPAWRKLQGVDIRYHRIGVEPAASGITSHTWNPSAPSHIPYHDRRSSGGAGIPYARTGSDLVSQSWNPYGARYEPARIRYHGWPMENGANR